MYYAYMTRLGFNSNWPYDEAFDPPFAIRYIACKWSGHVFFETLSGRRFQKCNGQSYRSYHIVFIAEEGLFRGTARVRLSCKEMMNGFFDSK